MYVDFEIYPSLLFPSSLIFSSKIEEEEFAIMIYETSILFFLGSAG